MQSLMFLGSFDQKLSKKNLWGVGSSPLVKEGLKEWIRNKLKVLASLSGQLGIKAAESLPGIIGGIVSWILNRAKDVVGWV